MCYRIIVLFSLLSILLGSCSTGYEPTQPIKVPKKWHHTDQRFTAKKDSTMCFAWWKQFNDPVFQHLITQGLASNNDIQIALAHIEAAKGELKRVELNWIPGASTALGYSSFPYLGYPGVLAAVIPSYTINLISQYYEQKRAQYELAMTKNMRDSVKLAVIAQISANYFSYLAQRNKLALLQHIESDEKEAIAIYQSAYHGGLLNNIDVEKLKSKLDKKRIIKR